MNKLNKITFKLQYKNQNGLQNFSGATYRILKSDNKTILIDSSVTNSLGETKDVYLKKDEMVYIQMFNKNKKIYESPVYTTQNLYFKGRGKNESINIVVTRSYFQIRLSDIKWRDINGWDYKLKIGTVNISGKIDGGRTYCISSDNMNLTEKQKNSVFIKEYNAVATSTSPFVTVTVIDPKTKREYTKTERVIPVGSKHEFRDFNIKQIITKLEPVENNSSILVKEVVDYKPFFIFINQKKGVLYDVMLENKEVFYDSSWSKITTKKVENGRSEQLFIPYNYKGNIYIKLNGKNYGIIPTIKNNNSTFSGPLIYSKDWFENFKLTSNDIAKGRISINRIGNIKQDANEIIQNNKYAKILQEASDNKLQAYIVEIKDYPGIEEKDYSDDDFLKMSAEACRHLTYQILANFTFDALVYPAGIYTYENFFHSKENKKLILTSIIMPLMEFKETRTIHNVRFRLQRNKKTGTLVIVFLGRARWIKYMNLVTMGIDKKKISMISSIYEIAYIKNEIKLKSPVMGLIKAGGKIINTSVKGSPLGLLFVAAADTLEWILDDNPEKRLTDLFGQLITDTMKSIISGIAGMIAGVLLASTTLPVIAVIAAGAVVMLAVSFFLEYADTRGIGTKGVPWNQISKDALASIWESIRAEVISYSNKASKNISNENQEFKFEPLI